MLLLLASEKARSRSGVARQLKVHRNTVADWLALYEEGGVEKLHKIGTPGPEPGQQSIPPEGPCRRSPVALPMRRALAATKRYSSGFLSNGR